MAESRTLAQRTGGERGVMLNSPMVSTPHRTKEKDPPRYGAQYRQDALWEGGNEAVPPQWHQYKLLDDRIGYQDDTLAMVSLNRPLPGVRLDYPGRLIPGCEWHISPFGRSYFVNHNTRTTLWKKPTPERPPGSLVPGCVIEGHSKAIWSLACLSTSCNILSASGDGSIRQWTIDGKPVGRPWNSDRRAVCSTAMSPDESLVVSGSMDGKLRLWNIREGNVVGDPWEGHGGSVIYIDWSPNAREIASRSQDGTIRRWDPDTDRQIAPPIETGHGMVFAVKYSPQGDKLTSGGEDKVIRVWSKDGELLAEIEGHDSIVTSFCWSKDGAHIFSASYDGTIRKWRSIDGRELIVFHGHTDTVHSLCFSPDESYLVSAARDYSVRIWDLKTNQPVGNPLLHDDEVWVVVISPDGKYIVSGGLDAKIYVWSLEAALKHTGNDPSADESDAKPNTKLKGRPVRPRDAILHASQVSMQQANNRLGGLTKYGNGFWDVGTNPAARPPVSPWSGFRWRSSPSSLRFNTRPSNTPQSIPLSHRRWNLKSLPVGSLKRTVEVAPCREEDRYGITPETDAEAVAAMRRTNSNEAGCSTQQGQPEAVPGTQVSQERPTDTQGSSGGMGEVSYEVRCCGLFFSCGRPTSHQS